jgi:hypothetical protein
MTAFDNFDRRLASFLDEGPVRAPERPVEAAIAHAAAHPRRRDLFGPLRRDVMARPMLWGARPVLVFAVLGLLLVVSGAAFIVGSQRQPSVAPPTPPAESPSSPQPSASPSPSTVPTPATFPVVITDSNGLEKTVIVTDASGLLEQALPWEANIDRPQRGEIEANQLPADEGGGQDGVIVQWLDLSCPNDVLLSIDAGARRIVVTVDSTGCEADAIGVDHGVWLDFSVPVPADEVSVELERAP